MKRKIFTVILVIALVFALAVPSFAAGDLSGVIENTWTNASGQVKTVVNKVVFPAIDLILVIALFVKLGMSYFEYRKHGQMEWTPAVVLFASLVFTLTAPLYIWTVLGM